MSADWGLKGKAVVRTSALFLREQYQKWISIGIISLWVSDVSSYSIKKTCTAHDTIATVVDCLYRTSNPATEDLAIVNVCDVIQVRNLYK